MNMPLIAQLLALHRRLRQRDSWTREQLSAHQAASLQRLRAHAYANSPFFQRFHAGLHAAPLRELPVLTKAQVMEHFDELATDRRIRRVDIERHVSNLRKDERCLDRYWVTATSGSTGRRGLFLFDRSAWLGVLATFARAPAEAQIAGTLDVAPSAIFTSAELLTDETRRTIEAAWGKRMFDQYAATETGNIAGECEQHAGLHVIEDLMILEVVDGDNRPVAPGTYGDKLLATVLFNRSQPLIRYELSDRVRLAAAPCSCGRPYVLIDGIEGRAEEVLRFAGARGGEVAVNPHVFHRVMDAAPVRGWQVVQESDRLDVLLSGGRDDGVNAALSAALGRELTAQGIVVPPIRVRNVPEIPRGATGKVLLIASHVSQGQQR